MSLDSNYEVSITAPQGGRQVVSQVFPGYALYNGASGSFLLVILNLTPKNRWAFQVYGDENSPYHPYPMRFLQITADVNDPVGAYAPEDANGDPDTSLGGATVGEWP